MSHILIVEDERISAEAIKIMLQKLDYKVVDIVSNSKDALESIQKKIPDLILIDIVLKGDMDGIELAELVNNKYTVPIIFITAYPEDEILRRALLTTPYGYLLKPVYERELHISIESALYKHKTDVEINNINRTLDSIRKLNHFLIREKKWDNVVNDSCKILTENKSYLGICITVFDINNNIISYTQSCSDQMFDLVKNSNTKIIFTKFGSEVIDSSDSFAIKNCKEIIENLPQGTSFPDKNLIVTKMNLSKNNFGLMIAELPISLKINKNVKVLFEEAARDCSYALRTIEHEEQRLKAERDLKESEENLRSTIASMDDLVFVLDNEGIFREYYQPVTKANIFMPKEKLINKSYKDVLPVEVANKFDKGLKKVIESQNVEQILYDLDSPDGKKWMSAKISLRKGTSKGGYSFTVVTSDITELKQNEIALKAHRENLEELVKERTLELESSNVELKKRSDELERFNKAMVGREVRMTELKSEINDLLKELGRENKYQNHISN